MVFLEQQLLNLLLDGVDLRLDLAALVLGDAGRDDGTRDAAGPAQRLLGPNEHVRHVLVLAEQRDVEQDLQGLAVGGKDQNALWPRLSVLVASLAPFRSCL